MSEDGLLSLTSLPMSMNPVESTGTSAGPLETCPALFPRLVPRGQPSTELARAGHPAHSGCSTLSPPFQGHVVSSHSGKWRLPICTEWSRAGTSQEGLALLSLRSFCIFCPNTWGDAWGEQAPLQF